MNVLVYSYDYTSKSPLYVEIRVLFKELLSRRTYPRLVFLNTGKLTYSFNLFYRF